MERREALVQEAFDHYGFGDAVDVLDVVSDWDLRDKDTAERIVSEEVPFSVLDQDGEVYFGRGFEGVHGEHIPVMDEPSSQDGDEGLRW